MLTILEKKKKTKPNYLTRCDRLQRPSVTDIFGVDADRYLIPSMPYPPVIYIH